MNNHLPVYATREATSEECLAADLPEDCGLMVITMPPLPDPFAKPRAEQHSEAAR